MLVQELIDRVREQLGDYGDSDAASALTADAADDDASLYVEDGSVFDIGDWLYVGNEVLEVSAETSETEVPVRHAMRGTEAEEHLEGDVVRAGLKFSNLGILQALNAALSGGFPMLFKIVEDVTLSVVEGQRLYELEEPVRDIRSVWMEDGIGSGEYLLTRLAVPQGRGSFQLHGVHETGLGIKVIGITTFPEVGFTQATEAGGTEPAELDDDFPDDFEAYDYLVKDACARLLYSRLAQTALDDAATSRGSQGQDDRYVLMNTAKAFKLDARESLRKTRMMLPRRVMPRPDARYFD